jgi:hypothetical protein
MQRIHRFGGQFEGIHVLGHSMEVASRLDRPVDKLWGLLHDAHEVLSGDVTRQFKSAHLLGLQAKCDMALGMELQSVGVRDLIDGVHVHDVDVAVGDDEHDNPDLYGGLYDFYESYQFSVLFESLLNECRNAQPQ